MKSEYKQYKVGDLVRYRASTHIGVIVEIDKTDADVSVVYWFARLLDENNKFKSINSITNFGGYNSEYLESI